MFILSVARALPAACLDRGLAFACFGAGSASEVSEVVAEDAVGTLACFGAGSAGEVSEAVNEDADGTWAWDVAEVVLKHLT